MRRRSQRHPPERDPVEVALTSDGMRYSSHGVEWWLDRTPAASGGETIAFLTQIEELGLAVPTDDGQLLVPWTAVYRVVEQDDLMPESRTLPVPPIDASVVPSLRSSGTLSDDRFSIAISGWQRRGGSKLSDQLAFVGPVAEMSPAVMLSEAAFSLFEAIRAFQRRPAEQ